MLYRKKFFLGNAYGTETPHLVYIDTYTFLAKYAHGGYSAYDVVFGTIPNIMQFIHSTLWDPIYYYDSEENYSSNNNNLVSGSYSSRITLSLRS